MRSSNFSSQNGYCLVKHIHTDQSWSVINIKSTPYRDDKLSPSHKKSLRERDQTDTTIRKERDNPLIQQSTFTLKMGHNSTQIVHHGWRNSLKWLKLDSNFPPISTIVDYHQ